MQQHHFTVSRTARYFTLGASNDPVRQVWFVCHGYGRLAQEFLADFAPLDDGRRLIVAPEGLSRYYTDHPARVVGASWMTREDRLAEISDYVAYLDALYRHVFDGLDRSVVTVHVLGFSQGAATVARWVTHGAAVVDRLILWGGMLPPDLDLGVAWGKLEDSRLTFVVGTRDPQLDAAELEHMESRLMEKDIPFEKVQFNGGHRLDKRVLKSLAGS
jgi:predicted esterase